MRWLGRQLTCITHRYRWQLGLILGFASITASQVAYCDARNRQMAGKRLLLKSNLQKVYPTAPPFAKLR